MATWLLGAIALWLICGWSAAFIHLPWKRIWKEPNPRLTVFASVGRRPWHLRPFDPGPQLGARLILQKPYASTAPAK